MTDWILDAVITVFAVVFGFFGCISFAAGNSMMVSFWVVVISLVALACVLNKEE